MQALSYACKSAAAQATTPPALGWTGSADALPDNVSRVRDIDGCPATVNGRTVIAEVVAAVFARVAVENFLPAATGNVHAVAGEILMIEAADDQVLVATFL